MSLAKSIFQHIKFYSIANFLGKGANVVIFLLIAKVFSVQEFAQYITIMIVIELLLVILLFGIDSYIMRAQSLSSFSLTTEFIKLNIVLNFLFFILLTFLFTINFLSLYKFLLLSTLNLYLFYRVMEKLFLNFLIRTQKSEEFMKITFVLSYTQLFLVLVAYYLDFLNITSYFFLLSITILVLVYKFFLKLKQENTIFLNKSFFKLKVNTLIDAIKLAFPFLGKNLIGSVNLYSSRILLAAFATPLELAAYGFYLALYFKAIGLLSVVSKTFIPMMKDSIDKINKIQAAIRKYEIFYLFFVLIFSLSLFIAYVKLPFFEGILLYLIKSEYIEMLEIGFIFVLCFFISLAIMIYDFWQYSLKNVAKKILTLSIFYMTLSVVGYLVILQFYGTTEIAFYYLIINTLMLVISRRLFYQIKPSNKASI